MITISAEQVNDIIDLSVDNRALTLSAPSRSGKTRMVAMGLAQKAFRETGDPTYILVSDSTNVVNVVETLTIDMSWNTGNKLVGHISSAHSGQSSLTDDSNVVVVVTMGYFLSSDLVSRARNVIIDAGDDTSLVHTFVRARLQNRMRSGLNVRLAIFSTNPYIEADEEYWPDAVVYRIENHYIDQFDNIEMISNRDVAGEIVKAATSGEYKHITVIATNRREINKIETEVIRRLRPLGNPNRDYEITSVARTIPHKEMERLSQRTRSRFRIVIGNRRIITGAPLFPSDKVITTGTHIVNQFNEGTSELCYHHMPKKFLVDMMSMLEKDKIDFGDVAVVNESIIDYADRPYTDAPDITRLPVEEIFIQASMRGLDDIFALQYTEREQVDHTEIPLAVDRLDILNIASKKSTTAINPIARSYINLRHRNLSYRGAAAFVEAEHLGMVSQMAPLITTINIGVERRIRTRRLELENPFGSDTALRTRKLCEFYAKNAHDAGSVTHEELAQYNISMRSFVTFQHMLRDITANGAETGIEFWTSDAVFDAKMICLIKQVIMAAYIDNVFNISYHGEAVVVPNERFVGKLKGVGNDRNVVQVELIRSSSVTPVLNETVKACGNIDVIEVRATSTRFAILEDVTLFSDGEMVHMEERFGRRMGLRYKKNTVRRANVRRDQNTNPLFEMLKPVRDSMMVRA